MKSYEDTTDVVVLAIYHAEEDGNYYLIARRRKNEFWEFVVGKVKKGESYEEAALRELEDEIEIDWDLDAVEVKKVGEPYKSPENPVYDLYPVLLEIPSETAWELGDEDLGTEHDSLAWITVDQLDDYDTMHQEKALELLGIT
ncbi:MAG: NUDIX domain-containing protein [Candidatus Nanohaloarchaea archaeon]